MSKDRERSRICSNKEWGYWPEALHAVCQISSLGNQLTLRTDKPSEAQRPLSPRKEASIETRILHQHAVLGRSGGVAVADGSFSGPSVHSVTRSPSRSTRSVTSTTQRGRWKLLCPPSRPRSRAARGAHSAWGCSNDGARPDPGTWPGSRRTRIANRSQLRSSPSWQPAADAGTAGWPSPTKPEAILEPAPDLGKQRTPASAGVLLCGGSDRRRSGDLSIFSEPRGLFALYLWARSAESRGFYPIVSVRFSCFSRI